MIVEDEKMIRKGIISMVKRIDISCEEIIECKNGEEALEILKNKKVDVLLTDIRMPKMDGITLVSHVNELKEKPIVIVVSGYDDFNYAVEEIRRAHV